jgi:predicted amidohydrolase
MRIAAAAYPVTFMTSWDQYETKLTNWVSDVAGQGADLLVFPEYGAMELAGLAGADVAADLEQSLWAVADLLGEADDLHQKLAVKYDCMILAASAPSRGHGMRPVNRARLMTPDGKLGIQDKQVMTRFEREVWNVVAGGPLQVFGTALGRIGVLICYDVEFPLLGRALMEAGVDLLLVPSCTDSLAGYWRVRIGAMARALEGQCIVVQSPTVGAADWSPAIDENVGAAAIYGPPDLGFPPTGVIAEGVLNSPGWIMADVDLGLVAKVRTQGRVLNHAHWPESQSKAIPVLEMNLRAD